MFRHILCSLLIGVLAVSLTGLAGANAVHKGRVLMTVESKIIILDEHDETLTFVVVPSAKITLDGRPAVLSQLNAGDTVRIDTEIVDGVETAVVIMARTME